MNDINQAMAKLSPIISKIGLIGSAIQNMGGPHFKTTRNPEGIVALLDFASTCNDPQVKARYKELITSEHRTSVEHLKILGHDSTPPEAMQETAANETYYRGAKVSDSTENIMPSNSNFVDGQAALDISANEPEVTKEVKTKTIKVVYRGKVSYKEVPI